MHHGNPTFCPCVGSCIDPNETSTDRLSYVDTLIIDDYIRVQDNTGFLSQEQYHAVVLSRVRFFPNIKKLIVRGIGGRSPGSSLYNGYPEPTSLECPRQESFPSCFADAVHAGVNLENDSRGLLSKRKLPVTEVAYHKFDPFEYRETSASPQMQWEQRADVNVEDANAGHSLEQEERWRVAFPSVVHVESNNPFDCSLVRTVTLRIASKMKSMTKDALMLMREDSHRDHIEIIF